MSLNFANNTFAILIERDKFISENVEYNTTTKNSSTEKIILSFYNLTKIHISQNK